MIFAKNTKIGEKIGFRCFTFFSALYSSHFRYYVRNKHHTLLNAPYVDNSCKWAGGGFLSNVLDLIKFGNAMLYSYQAGNIKKPYGSRSGVRF